MSEHKRTFYTVTSFWWYDPGYNQNCYWREDGCGPCGNTIEDAHNRVKQDIKRFVENGADLTKIKFKIIKTVTIDTVEEELVGPDDFTALVLKTC